MFGQGWLKDLSYSCAGDWKITFFRVLDTLSPCGCLDSNIQMFCSGHFFPRRGSACLPKSRGSKGTRLRSKESRSFERKNWSPCISAEKSIGWPEVYRMTCLKKNMIIWWQFVAMRNHLHTRGHPKGLLLSLHVIHVPWFLSDIHHPTSKIKTYQTCYPLVIYHSHGKWPIYRWISH